MLTILSGSSENLVKHKYSVIKAEAIATRFLEAIKEQGLVAGSRQYVHLSSDETTAIAVGQRHGKPCVLKIKALLMYKQGIKFYQADNGVWLTKTVPTLFIDWQ